MPQPNDRHSTPTSGGLRVTDLKYRTLARPHLEALPVGALVPVGQLVPGHRGVAVLGEVDAKEVGVHVPGHERAHSSKTHVRADQQPPAQLPLKTLPLFRIPPLGRWDLLPSTTQRVSLRYLLARTQHAEFTGAGGLEVTPSCEPQDLAACFDILPCTAALGAGRQGWRGPRT